MTVITQVPANMRVNQTVGAWLEPTRKRSSPTDAAWELERRELEARKREHIEQEWARLWPPEKDLSTCAWGPRCARCAELNRQLEAQRGEG